MVDGQARIDYADWLVALRSSLTKIFLSTKFLHFWKVKLSRIFAKFRTIAKSLTFPKEKGVNNEETKRAGTGQYTWKRIDAGDLTT